MANARFVVSKVGPHTSIQDTGRAALMRFGVPRSGPMDRTAFAAANAALGNHVNAPQIEVSIAGLTLACTDGAISVALTGGGFQAAIDGVSMAAWSVATIQAGSSLVIRPGVWGNWCYLAFAGQLQASSWLHSVSTHGPSGLGGGRLTVGQELIIQDARADTIKSQKIPFPVFARPRHSFRVVLGPQDRFFSQSTIETLLSEQFSLTDSYDRMGVRLAGPLLCPQAAMDMPSEAIVRGSVQVSGDGVATVLLADHQTTGGYPKIATILSDDLDRFVQLRSRSQIRFEAVSPDEAIQISRTRHQVREQYLQQPASTGR